MQRLSLIMGCNDGGSTSPSRIAASRIAAARASIFERRRINATHMSASGVKYSSSLTVSITPDPWSDKHVPGIITPDAAHRFDGPHS